MMKAVVLCAIALSCCTAVEVTMNPAMMQSIGSAASSIPQLVVQQEFQRRLADLYISFQMIANFHTMSTLEIQSETAPRDNDFARNTIEDDLFEDDVLLEDDDIAPLPSRSWVKDRNDYELDAAPYPFRDDSRDEYENDAAPYPYRNPDRALEEDSEDDEFGSFLQVETPKPTYSQLQSWASTAKFTALKHLNLQVIFAASDIDRAYWTNQQLALVLPPQLVVLKVYKNYLSTIALSTAIQLHDSYTLEAFLDDFNDKFGDLSTKSEIKEILAEQQLFSKWSVLAFLKLQLFFLSNYEQSVATSLAGASGSASSFPVNANANVASFLEEQLKTMPAEPSIGGSFGGDNAQLRAYVTYYERLLKVVVFYTEIQLSQAGLMQANLRAAAHHMLSDDTPLNDDHGVKSKQLGEQLEKYVPRAFLHWTTVQQLKLTMEYYKFYLDIYMPELAPLREMQRQSDSIQDVMLVQTDKETENKAQPEDAAKLLF